VELLFAAAFLELEKVQSQENSMTMQTNIATPKTMYGANLGKDIQFLHKSSIVKL